MASRREPGLWNPTSCPRQCSSAYDTYTLCFCIKGHSHEIGHGQLNIKDQKLLKNSSSEFFKCYYLSACTVLKIIWKYHKLTLNYFQILWNNHFNRFQVRKFLSCLFLLWFERTGWWSPSGSASHWAWDGRGLSGQQHAMSTQLLGQSKHELRVEGGQTSSMPCRPSC